MVIFLDQIGVGSVTHIPGKHESLIIGFEIGIRENAIEVFTHEDFLSDNPETYDACYRFFFAGAVS